MAVIELRSLQGKGQAQGGSLVEEPAQHEWSVEQDTRPAQVDEVGKVLLDAAAILERDGWCQGEILSFDGRRCALGAIGEAAGAFPVGDKILFDDVRPGTGQLYLDVTERLRKSLGLGEIGIGFWNDRPERTQETVVEALTRAAYGA